MPPFAAPALRSFAPRFREFHPLNGSDVSGNLVSIAGHVAASHLVPDMSADQAKPPSPLFDMRSLVDNAPGANERLRQLQCLATIGQVAVGVGHELRNYLIPITAHAQLASELTDNEEALEHLAGIQRAIQRCRGLIDQVLAAGRDVSVQKRPLCIRAIAQAPLPLLRASVPRAIELKITVGERIPLVDTDAASIEQLVLN